jgi:hypothetical protein
MNLKFKDGIDYVTFDNLMEEDGNVVYELSRLASNIKKEVVGVLDSFFFFLKKYKERKSHNIYFYYWTLGLKLFVLCLHLLVMNKVREFLKNMIENICFLCFLNVIIICILWLNLKRMLLIKGLKRTTI